VEETVPDFQNIFLYVGWGMRRPVFGKWVWSGNIQIGNSLMKFAQAEGQREQLGEKKEYESELGAGITFGFSYQPIENWAVSLSVISDYVHTHRPLRSTSFSAGVSYTISTPAWLREFLE
jgi:hypothetical protein